MKPTDNYQNNWMSDVKFNEEQIEKNQNSKTRYDICKSCDKFTELKFCQVCSCFMPLKVRFPKAECPEGKW